MKGYAMSIHHVLVTGMLFLAVLAQAGEHATGSKITTKHGSTQGEAGMSDKSEAEKKAVKPVGESAAVDLSALETLSSIISKAAKKKIVYVGEYHDQFSNHEVQLEVIKGLHKKNRNIAVGMEMFQRPYQQALDDFIAGRLYERDFLKKSEYFKRWRFDYNLYKPILDYCREHTIPVVALNVRRELTEKVSKEGIDSLSNEEKKEIPPDMDLSDDEYRKRLKEVFDQHRGTGRGKFDFFYQAQVLWDESMSRSVDEFLKKRRGTQMVVLAGGGHLAFGSGIPKRTFRRNGHAYAIILNDVDIEKNIAHYIVYPESVDGMTAPKLGVMLKENEGTVTISAFAGESVAAEAGLKTGDRITAVNGMEVESVADIRIALFYANKGDTLKVKVLRKRFLFGDKEMEVPVTLK